MTRTPAIVLRARRWLLVCACAGLGACSWLEGEFSSLDRLPPSARTADAPALVAAEQP